MIDIFYSFHVQSPPLCTHRILSSISGTLNPTFLMVETAKLDFKASNNSISEKNLAVKMSACGARPAQNPSIPTIDLPQKLFGKAQTTSTSKSNSPHSRAFVHAIHARVKKFQTTSNLYECVYRGKANSC